MRTRPEPEDSDDQLSRWLAEGYAPAFRTALLLLGNRADAEEAVQEAFLRAWRFRAAIPDEDGIRPWLYRVVVNASLSKLRTDGRRNTRTVHLDSSSSEPGIVEPRTDGPEAWAVGEERRRVLLDVIASLPEHLRVVVVLRYYSQLSEKEIAAVIHRRPGTAKSRLHQARARLGDDGRLLALTDRPFTEPRFTRPAGKTLVCEGGDAR